jgi:enoyl-CoA hydratase
MGMALTGDALTAERAHHHGLVNALTAAGDALDGARALAARIARNGPLAVRVSKRVVAASPGWPADEVWTRQAEAVAPIFTSADAREGAAAFAEKREPRWTGR